MAEEISREMTEEAKQHATDPHSPLYLKAVDKHGNDISTEVIEYILSQVHEIKTLEAQLKESEKMRIDSVFNVSLQLGAKMRLLEIAKASSDYWRTRKQEEYRKRRTFEEKLIKTQDMLEKEYFDPKSFDSTMTIKDYERVTCGEEYADVLLKRLREALK